MHHYTKRTITRVFIRKHEVDDTLWDMWQQKERSIRFWMDKQGEALHRNNDLYGEILALRKRITELEAALAAQPIEPLPPLLQLLADTEKRKAV